MSGFDSVKLFLLANFLTVYYTIGVLLSMLLNYLKNPFADSGIKLRLEPPPILTDLKFGTHKYIKVNNTKLHYIEKGDPSKTLMIFLHGFPEFWYSWRHQLLDLSKDYWCIAVDMRGFADSEKPEEESAYKLEVLIEDIRDLVRQLGREKCILVSHDWGGIVACRFREVYPEVLEAVITLASVSREAWLEEIFNNPVQRKMSWYVFFFRCPSIPENYFQSNLSTFFGKVMLVEGKNSVTENDIECYKYWYAKQGAFTPALSYYRANFQCSIPETKCCELPIPFLYAQASGDLFLSHSLADTMKKHYKHIETTIIEGCGHYCQQEEPEKVNQVIRQFLLKHNIK